MRRHGSRPQSPWAGDLALPSAARAQSGALALVERRRSGRGQAARLPDPALHRLRRLPLVPCDGARVVRESGDGASHERTVRQHQSRPRGAAGHRPHLHDRAPCAGPAGRLAAHHVSHARRQADDRRHLLAARAALWPALVPAGSPIDRLRVAHAARPDGEPRPHPRRPSGETLRVERGSWRLARRPHPRRRRARKARSIRSTAA